MIKALKPVYNHKTKTYGVQVLVNANPLLAHEGWLIYDNAETALDAIQRGPLLSHWVPKKRAAAIAHLTAETDPTLEPVSLDECRFVRTA